MGRKRVRKFVSKAKAYGPIRRDPTPAQIARFEERIDRSDADGCWTWTALCNPMGYGVFTWNDQVYGAHRMALIWRDRVDRKGVSVLHRCDNPPCVRVDHLYWGDAKQNAKDRVDRDRQPRGQRSYNAKLTDSDVTYIWTAYYNRERSYDQLMDMFRVCRAVIDRIILKKTWTHVTSVLPQPPVFPMPAFKAVGARHGMSVLTADQVQPIRRRLRAGETIASIARDLRVGESTIRNLRNGATWKHVPDTAD